MAQKKKFVFVHPNQQWSKFDLTTTWRIPPMVLCRLAATIEDLVEVEILDCQLHNMSEEQYAEEIRARKPDYLGVSMLTSEYAATLNTCADIAKTINPDVVVIAGGVHVTVDPLATMNNPNIDYGCMGEGEEFLPEFVRWLEDMGEMPESGLIYRDEKGEVVIQDRRLVDDLDKLPAPNYRLVHMPDYLETQNRYGPNRLPALPGMAITVSRGCPFGCTFCQVEVISGAKIRVPSAEKVVDEIEWLVKECGIKSLVWFDDNLFAAHKKAKAILREMIKRDLGLKWSVAAFAIFATDDELLDLMKEAGCVGVNVAIESGSERVMREIVQKPIRDLSLVPQLVQDIKDRGMFVLANFIIGFPGETWEEIRQTVRFAETCNADYVKFFVAVPLRGTKLFDMAIQMGALDQEAGDPKVDWRFSQIQSDEWTTMDVSTLRAYEWDRINFAPDRIERVAEIWGQSVDEINEIRRQTRRNLYVEKAETGDQLPENQPKPEQQQAAE